MEETNSSREQDAPQLQSMKQTATDQLETSEASQPKISSLPDSAQSTNTSPLTSKIFPQLSQGSLMAGTGSNKINPMVTSGHHGPLNNQHHMGWNHAQVHHSELRAKKKFYKWCSILATLVIAIFVPLFFFLFYRK